MVSRSLGGENGIPQHGKGSHITLTPSSSSSSTAAIHHVLQVFLCLLSLQLSASLYHVRNVSPVVVVAAVAEPDMDEVIGSLTDTPARVI